MSDTHSTIRVTEEGLFLGADTIAEGTPIAVYALERWIEGAAHYDAQEGYWIVQHTLSRPVRIPLHDGVWARKIGERP